MKDRDMTSSEIMKRIEEFHTLIKEKEEIQSIQKELNCNFEAAIEEMHKRRKAWASAEFIPKDVKEGKLPIEM